MENKQTVTVIGAGLAGSEAAWQIAQAGYPVRLFEMKPQKFSPAHKSAGFAELICSNSLKAARIDSAAGLLKEEMRRMDSLLVACADKTAVPAGGALAVDRDRFSELVTKAITEHPNIEVKVVEATQSSEYEPKTRALAQAGQKLGRCAEVHLKLDTGMNRIGVRTAEEAQALTRLIDSLPGVALTGCFTHMATADEPDPTGTLRQIERFEALCKAVKAAHPGEIICHGANTASIFRYPQLHADMVRGGLALYGYPPVPEATGLQPAMRWVTRGIYVKTIAPGDRVSYGGTFVATRPTVVMTLPVGYADGYRRGISGKGCVLVRGRRAPILGRVCMDQMMVDVTDIPGAREGDEAVLLGRQGDEQIDAEEMAAWLDTISYEVLCSPSKRVPRVYINE